MKYIFLSICVCLLVSILSHAGKMLMCFVRYTFCLPLSFLCNIKLPRLSMIGMNAFAVLKPSSDHIEERRHHARLPSMEFTSEQPLDKSTCLLYTCTTESRILLKCMEPLQISRQRKRLRWSRGEYQDMLQISEND